MPRYLAIYIGTATARQKAEQAGATSPQTVQAGMAAWGEWVGKHRASIVDIGSPLGRTKRVSGDGIADITNSDVAYVIVEAPSHAEAAAMFIGHPHFAILPGDSIEVMECLPMPGT